jgi:CO dehydrogenase maturation factor
MIIGFLGKGGSGKTTLSTAMVHFLHGNNNTVLAIDADHNMDLTYNLGITEQIPYLGEAMPHLKSQLNMLGHYRDMFSNASEEGSGTQLPSFCISETNPDAFTKTYSTFIKPKLNIMSAGPHTEEVLQGNHCSHSLSTPLRIYLPLLNLSKNEYVVVDEKAGRDGAGTGTPSGFDIAFICAEPTVYGMKAASQIAEILDVYATPYEFIINKAEDTHMDQAWNEWKTFLPKEPALKIPKIKDNLDPFANLMTCMKEAHDCARKYAQDPKASNETRKLRSILKFKKQKEFLVQQTVHS